MGGNQITYFNGVGLGARGKVWGPMWWGLQGWGGGPIWGLWGLGDLGVVPRAGFGENSGGAGLLPGRVPRTTELVWGKPGTQVLRIF